MYIYIYLFIYLFVLSNFFTQIFKFVSNIDQHNRDNCVSLQCEYRLYDRCNGTKFFIPLNFRILLLRCL